VLDAGIDQIRQLRLSNYVILSKASGILGAFCADRHLKRSMQRRRPLFKLLAGGSSMMPKQTNKMSFSNHGYDVLSRASVHSEITA
jgi:hypothetical protein